MLFWYYYVRVVKSIRKIVYIVLFLSTIPLGFYYKMKMIENSFGLGDVNDKSYIFWGLLLMFIVLLLIEWDKKKNKKKMPADEEENDD